MRASFHVQQTRDGLQLGLHEEGTHRVVDLDVCLQVSPNMNRTQRALRDALSGRPDQARHVQGVDLGESLDGTRIVACLETDLDAAEATELVTLADAAPWLSGFGVVAGDGRLRRYVHLRGEPFVDAAVHGIRLRAHIRSFFQANRFLVDDLVSAVERHTPPGGTVLDLYAGVGLFALPLARRAEKVRGVEWNPVAVEDAAFNVAAAGQSHVRIEEGDVAKALSAWPAGTDERIVLDPPRAGAGPAVARAVAARGPKSIVYVSCDPATLVRDLKTLEAEGFFVHAVELFDLFPDTFHLETVAALRPR